MNIFFHELKTYRKSTFIWIIALSLITIMFLSIYTSFTKDVTASKKLLESLPYAVKQGLGISINSFFTIYGLFAYIYLYVLLAGAVQAMNLGVGVLSKEISGKTADFLLTKPVSRTSVLAQKIGAVTVLLIITNIVYIAIAYVTARLIVKSALDIKLFMLIALTLIFVQVIFMSIGILLSVCIPKIKSVISVTLPTVFAFFIIGAIGAIVGNQTVRYITPFKFFDSNYIIANRSYEVKYIVLEAILVIVMLGLSFVVFIRKDVRAAA